MINSLTNHMELFEFTFWNKSQILQTWKETEIRSIRSIESLRAPFTPDQPLGARLQLQRRVLLTGNRSPATNTTNILDYRRVLVIGLQVYNVNTGWIQTKNIRRLS